MDVAGYREEFGLDTYQSAAAMQIAVAKIPFTAGDTTDTGDAIQHARDVFLRQARPGVPRIIICITDGRSTIRATTVQVREGGREGGERERERKGRGRGGREREREREGGGGGGRYR